MSSSKPSPGKRVGPVGSTTPRSPATSESLPPEFGSKAWREQAFKLINEDQLRRAAENQAQSKAKKPG
ncbi:MAG: hypothetical protein KF683_19695 [Rubrivivax sp.]|nr:hypothetical protein [Rubrivivax sp.]